MAVYRVQLTRASVLGVLVEAESADEAVEEAEAIALTGDHLDGLGNEIEWDDDASVDLVDVRKATEKEIEYGLAT